MQNYYFMTKKMLLEAVEGCNIINPHHYYFGPAANLVYEFAFVLG